MRKILGLGAIAVFVLAACGSKSNTPASAGGSPRHQMEGAGTLTVNTGTVPRLGTVLVDGRGFTLYHLKTESGSNITCTGSCASTWPPLLVSGGAAPTGGADVTGTLDTVARPDGGEQVTYMGLTLYTYSGDTGPGQFNGQGVGGVWFAVTPKGLSGQSSSGGGGRYGGGYGSSPSSGTGYGY